MGDEEKRFSKPGQPQAAEMEKAQSETANRLGVSSETLRDFNVEQLNLLEKFIQVITMDPEPPEMAELKRQMREVLQKFQ